MPAQKRQKNFVQFGTNVEKHMFQNFVIKVPFYRGISSHHIEASQTGGRNFIQQSSVSQTPELQGDADRVFSMLSIGSGFPYRVIDGV